LTHIAAAAMRRATLFLLLQLLGCVTMPRALCLPQAQPQPGPGPPHTEHARLARWLAQFNDWGTLSFRSGNTGVGGGVVSFAAGPPGSAATAGRLFFYLTHMDETGQQIQVRTQQALVLHDVTCVCVRVCVCVWGGGGTTPCVWCSATVGNAALCSCCCHAPPKHRTTRSVRCL
jgi:hypothetical protein